MRVGAITLVLLAAMQGCAPSSEPVSETRDGSPPEARREVQPASVESGPFREVAAEAGLEFRHFNGMVGELHMAEVMGAGAALLDYDNDGDLDVYFVQGAMVRQGTALAEARFPPREGEPRTDRLFRNDLTADGLRFTDVTAEAGFHGEHYGMGVATGDYDNDGHVDLYVTNRGPNQLWRNRGDGTFEDATSHAGANDPRWSVPAVFFDYDQDGWLDLFIGNYVAIPDDRLPACADLAGTPDYCGPATFTAQPDRLLRNRGDGTFEEVTQSSGLASAEPAPALGALPLDLDDDGRIDLYVANDPAPNHFWRNRGDGTFEEVAMLSGNAVNGAGKAEASMGVDAADYDHDGDLDLFLTHLIAESNTLYRNEGGGLFVDATPGSGLGPASRLRTGFGTGWLDFDHDGWLDLLVVNGAVQHLEALARAGDPFPLHEPNLLFRNRGDGRFETVPNESGPLELSEVSRAAAFGDIDNDGDVDVLITQNNGPARLLLHRNPPPAWIGIHPRTGQPGRDVPGARVALLLDGETPRWRRVRIEGSYLCAHDPRVLFSLQESDRVTGIRIRWPDGAIEHWPAPGLKEYTRLARGTGKLVEP